MEDSNILFYISETQAEAICKYFDKDINILEEYEICELLDRIIDNL